jgi:DNA-binding response OmpR family regulator
MTRPIDVLLIEPSELDAQKMLAAIRRKAPGVSAVHVSGAEVAAGLIFDYWPAETPQMPRLLMLDLAAAGESGKAILHRLRSHAATRNVPAVLILKPVDCDEHDAALTSALDQWLVNGS